MSGQKVNSQAPSQLQLNDEITKYHQNLKTLTKEYIKKIHQLAQSTSIEQLRTLLDNIRNDTDHLINELKSSINELNTSKEKIQETFSNFEEYLYPEPIDDFEEPDDFLDSDSECSNNEFDEIINDHRTTRFGCFDIHADDFLDSDSECSNNEFDDIINDHRTTRFGCHDIHADDFLD